MIRHLFKLVWNQKWRNFGLSFEIFFSFLVLFAVFSFGVASFQKYLKPLGFEYERIWAIYLNWQDQEDAAVVETQRLIADQLEQYAAITHFSFCSRNIPFTGATHQSSIHYQDDEFHSSIYTVDDQFDETLQIPLLAGRWFNAEDAAAAVPPVIIGEKTSEYFFGEESPLGKELLYEDEVKVKVIGVSAEYRYRGELEGAESPLFFRHDAKAPLPRILLKVEEGAGAAFEAQLVSDLQKLAPNWSFEVNYLEDMRKDKLRSLLTPLLIMGIISGFLIFNVALGLFGVLWQNIRKRREEIGIRRSMGATQGSISRQFIGEVLVLATLSLALGLFFAIQFPLLNIFEQPADIYLWAMLLASLTIYLLVLVCALFPSRQAAKLHPAVALRED